MDFDAAEGSHSFRKLTLPEIYPMSISSQYGIPFCCVLITAIAASCYTAFEPLAPMEPRPVYYSLITTARDTQFVKVSVSRGEQSTSSNPDNLNPVITLSRAGQSAQTNTIVPSVQAYAAFPFRAEFGATHTLRIETQKFGAIEAAAIIPQRASFDIAGRSTLDTPDKSPIDIMVRVTFHPTTRAFRIRFYLEADVVRGADTTLMWQEIPLNYTDSLAIIRTGSSPSFGRLEVRTVENVYKQKAYVAAIALLLAKSSGANRVLFRRVAIHATHSGEEVYKYYSIANGFIDPNSIRADQPDYSNIPGGFGFFGGIAEQRFEYALPEDFAHNR